jgi:hypothetical protein
MTAVNRVLGLRGPRFYWGADDAGQPQMMFIRIYDASTREGPRPATRADSEAHVQAWAAFVQETNGIPEARRPMFSFADPEEGPPAPQLSERQAARQAAHDRGEQA